MIASDGFAIINQKMLSTAAKAGKPERGAEISKLDRSGRFER